MQTIIYPCDGRGIEIASRVIREGGLVAMPTETVYGLAADGLNPEAVREIYRVKGRPSDNPLILHIADLSMLSPLILADERVMNRAKKLSETFWPGPLTMVFYRSEKVPDIITAGGPTVAIRMPLHPAARALIAAAKTPIAAPSANLSGKPSPTNLRDVSDDLTGRIPVILDGGDSAVGVESTVVDLTRERVDLLRAGGVSREELEASLGEEVGDVSSPVKGEPVRSPGMKYKHYAPSTPLTALVGSGKDSLGWLASLREEDRAASGVIAFSEYQKALEELSFRVLPYGSEHDASEQAHAVFSALREGDRLGVGHLYIQMSPDKSGRGAAVYNRVLRACGGDLVCL